MLKVGEIQVRLNVCKKDFVRLGFSQTLVTI